MRAWRADALPDLVVSGVNDGARHCGRGLGRLACSDIVRQVPPPAYLTVSLPDVPPAQITGVEVVDRARGILGGRAQRDHTVSQPAGKEVWSIEIRPRAEPGVESDMAAVGRSHIAVVPMRVGDADRA